MEGQSHAVGPTETILRGIFAAARGRGDIHNIVFFHHAPSTGEHFLIQRKPALCDGRGEIIVSVAAQADHRQPLQWRPAVGVIPLLAGSLQRGNKPAVFKKIALQNMGDAFCLTLCRDGKIQRINRGE